MRVPALVFLTMFLVASAAWAQPVNEVSLFLSNVSSLSYSSSDELRWYTGVGVGYSRMIRPNVSAQLAVAMEEHRTYPYFVGPTGDILPVQPHDIRTYPVHLAARYHWVNDTRWKPYLGLGLRYVAAPDVDSRFRFEDKLNAEAVGGVQFLVKPEFGIELEARQLAGDREHYDQLFKLSVGVNWRF